MRQNILKILIIVSFCALFSSTLFEYVEGCNSGSKRADPSTCRIFGESCLPEVCKQLKQYHWIDCDEGNTRQKVRDRLKTCTNFNDCFNDLIDFNQITSANCRARPDVCMLYVCDHVKSAYSVDCEEGDNKNRLRDLLENCHAPKVDLCLRDVVNWKKRDPIKVEIKIVTDGPTNSQITSAYCRANPDYCLPYACDHIKAFTSASCSEVKTRDRLKLLLKNCHAPKVDLCLKQASDWQYDNKILITPASCRSNPEQCMAYACHYVSSRNWADCNSFNTREKIVSLIRTCFKSQLELCLDDVSKWQKVSDNTVITSANCRANPHSCLDYACYYVESRGWVYCSYQEIRDKLIVTLRKCFAPNVDKCLDTASNWKQTTSVTTTNCRNNPNSCLPYACQYAESKRLAKCSNNDVKGRLTNLMKKCQASNVDMCLDEASKWQKSTITPAICRSNPNSCLSYACEYVESKNWVRCSTGNMRDRLVVILRNCYTPKIDYCLNEASKWSQTSVTPANCRASPESCLPYSCQYVESRNWLHCSMATTKDRLVDILRTCRAPNVDSCLNQASKWDVSNLTPATCRANPSQCIDYACLKIQRLNGKSCRAYDVKNALENHLKSCYAPRIDDCLKGFPQLRRSAVLSPSICAQDPERCMPYACSKVRKDYGKDCSNRAFRSELIKLLRRCNSVSVDLCLTNVPYEIRI